MQAITLFHGLCKYIWKLESAYQKTLLKKEGKFMIVYVGKHRYDRTGDISAR